MSFTNDWTIPRLTYLMARGIAPMSRSHPHWRQHQHGHTHVCIDFMSQCISKRDNWKRIKKIRSGNAKLRYFSSCTIAEFSRSEVI